MNTLPVHVTQNGGPTAGGKALSGKAHKRGGSSGSWSFPTWLMICALVLYPLSVGPISWCWEEVILSQDDTNQFRARRDRGAAEAPFMGRFYVLPGIYQPLMWAYGSAPAVRNMMDGYLRMWGRLLTLQPIPNFEFRFPKLSPWEDSKTTGMPVQICSGSSGTGDRNAVRDFLGGGAQEGDGVGFHSHKSTDESGGGTSGLEFTPCLIKR
ncbi:MAG: hypothetical protein ACAI35_26780 [Candidatus Methylacidiphilales bacterium]|nr:hypothetical protein [Candidatus Methylacidiphilales bacterium]